MKFPGYVFAIALTLTASLAHADINDSGADRCFSIPAGAQAYVHRLWFDIHLSATSSKERTDVGALLEVVKTLQLKWAGESN